jgi:hypothetical protein
MQKSGRAYCPAGTTVLNGGVYMVDSGDMVLPYSLIPVHPSGGALDYFEVSAAETRDGYGNDVYPDDWTMLVYAICATGVTGVHILHVQSPTDYNSSISTFKEQDAVCPSGQQALGATAAISSSGIGLANLVLMRPDGYMIEARASARRNSTPLFGPGGVSFVVPWLLTTYVVCADPIVKVGPTGLIPAPTANRATVYCDPSKPMFAIGGGGGVFDTGPAYIHDIFPFPASGTYGMSSEVDMTAAPSGGMIVEAVCGP